MYPPGAITNLTAEIYGMDVRLNWTLPAVGANQRALQHTRIERREGAGSFAQFVNVPAPTTTLLIGNELPGDYEYRATAIDTANVAGPSATVSKTVPSGSLQAPGAITGFSATLE